MIFNKSFTQKLETCPLNPDKEKHNAVLEALRNLMTTLDWHLLHSNAVKDGQVRDFDNVKFSDETNVLLEKGRELLHDEWRKIQSLI